MNHNQGQGWLRLLIGYCQRIFKFLDVNIESYESLTLQNIFPIQSHSFSAIAFGPAPLHAKSAPSEL